MPKEALVQNQNVIESINGHRIASRLPMCNGLNLPDE
jgi:hypothetical protein